MTKAERRAISEEWSLVGEDALDAANALAQAGHHRSAVSRSYYGAYAFLASALVRVPAVNFPEDREGPGHESLADLVRVHLGKVLPERVRQQAQENIQVLYQYRLWADYRPRNRVDRDVTRECEQRAVFIANRVRKINR